MSVKHSINFSKSLTPSVCNKMEIDPIPNELEDLTCLETNLKYLKNN